MEIMDEGKADFKDIALAIAKPELAADSSICISSNCQAVAQKIQAVVDRYKDTELTESNVQYVQTLKRQFVSLRTGIEREREQYLKAYITPARDFVNSVCKELLDIVDKGESALKAQLDRYDQKRKDELTEVLRQYVDEASEARLLRPEFKAKIQLLQKYYNKTQDEADSIDDINRQADEALKSQKEADAGIALVKEECEAASMLADPYLRELSYKSAMEVVMEVKRDAKAKAEAEKKARDEAERADTAEAYAVAAAAAASDPAVYIKASDESADEEEDEVRVRTFRLTYKASNASKIAAFLKEACEAIERVD